MKLGNLGLSHDFARGCIREDPVRIARRVAVRLWVAALPIWFGYCLYTAFTYFTDADWQALRSGEPAALFATIVSVIAPPLAVLAVICMVFWAIRPAARR